MNHFRIFHKYDRLLDKMINFNKYSDAILDTLNTTYDYESIMHYGPTAFSVNNETTIEPLQLNIKIGQRYYLSAIDIQEIQLYYNCTNEGPTLAPSTTVTTTLRSKKI